MIRLIPSGKKTPATQHVTSNPHKVFFTPINHFVSTFIRNCRKSKGIFTLRPIATQGQNLVMYKESIAQFQAVVKGCYLFLPRPAFLLL